MKEIRWLKIIIQTKLPLSEVISVISVEITCQYVIWATLFPIPVAV